MEKRKGNMQRTKNGDQPMNNDPTAEELIRITGAEKNMVQKRILKNHGIGFILRADKTVCTTWEAVNYALKSKTNESANDNEIDFSSLDKLSG